MAASWALIFFCGREALLVMGTDAGAVAAVDRWDNAVVRRLFWRNSVVRVRGYFQIIGSIVLT